MKKSIFYIFFLIILPLSFGSSENTGCNYSGKEAKNNEKIEGSHQSDNFRNTKTTVNSQK